MQKESKKSNVVAILIPSMADLLADNNQYLE